MNSRYIVFSMFWFALLILITACATLKPGKEKYDGFYGVVVPVDSKGKEIELQDREKVIINCVPVSGGILTSDGPFTFNPDTDGKFVAKLRHGEYSVEIFLKGFYVKSFKITITEGELIDIGVVRLEEITAEEGEPIMNDDSDEVILNEGDVNIEPPSL
jgi:hypothetical protein